jgi:N-acetylneuraminate lyase
VRESCELAAHAEENGADAFSATPPSYFRPENLDVLVACVAEIAAAAPSLPFYYYHLPDITQVRFDMTAFLAKAAPIIPNLRGIKFSALQIFEMQACVEWENGRFDIVFGSDEMLLSGLVGGARGAVGSTYNFAAPLFRRVIAAFEQGDLATATAEQSRAASMIERILRPIGRGGLKATMAVLGCNCGPNRLPIVTATARDRQLIEAGLGELGLLDLLRPGQETLVPAAAK